MADEAARRAEELGLEANFYTSDLESVTGKYDTVTCVDVAIHYPTDKMQVKHAFGAFLIYVKINPLNYDI